jgi:cobalamin biosynthesis Mg chelatase CobN
VNGNCGKNETPPPATTTTPPPGQQAVLGERESGTTPKTAPESTTGSSPEQKVLGETESGTTPTSATAPAAATQARPASSNKSLPFTGTDLIVVLLAGVIALTAGLALRRLASHRA